MSSTRMQDKLRVLAAVVLSASFVAIGCKGTTPAATPSATPATSSAPATSPAATPAPMAIRNPDGSITNPDGSVTYASGSKVAEQQNRPNGSPGLVAAAPARERTPAVVRDPGSATADGVEPAARVSSATVPSGTPVVVRLSGGLAASRNNVGDRFNGVLEQALTSRGATVFAAGTPVSGEVMASKGKGRFKGAGDLGIMLTTIGRKSVTTSEYEKSLPGRGKRTAGFAGGGAGLGAIIGGLAGGGKGALLGGLAGAGAGTAAGAYTGNRDVVIPAESVITFRLTQSLTR